MKKTKLVYTRLVEDEKGARTEKFKVILTDKLANNFTKHYTSYKLRCLTAEDLKNIWTNNEEDLSCELCRDEILDVQDDLKDELIEYDPVEIIKLDDEDYGDWEQKEDECSIEEVEAKSVINEKHAEHIIQLSKDMKYDRDTDLLERIYEYGKNDVDDELKELLKDMFEYVGNY